MRQVVRDSFFDFTAKREGFTPFMYCDILNLVTTGVGNLIDRGARNGFDTSANAMAPAMALPWRHKGPGWDKNNPIVGDPLTPAQIALAWTATKLKEQESPGFNKRGGFAYTNLTDASLSMADLKALFTRTLDSFDKALAAKYPGWEEWPADAQQATMSMSWAMGPAFKFDAFKAAVDRKDFDQAGELSFFKGGGGTIDKRTGRNAENVVMFHNAAIVQKAGSGFDQIWFPGTANPGAGPGPGAVSPGNLISKVPNLVPNITVANAEKVALGAAGVGALGTLGYFIHKWWTDRR